MCRTTEFDGFYTRDRRRLQIGAFYVRLIGLRKSNKDLPESLTLLFPPRIDEAELSVGVSKVRPDSRAFVSLHRVVAGSVGEEEAAFGSLERIRAGEGVRFEVFLREEKILEGMFRQGGEDEEMEEWRMEVRSGVEEGREAGVAAAEVCVGIGGHVALSELVEIASKKRRRRRKVVGNMLEVIPEGREEAISESDGLCCCCCDGEGSDGWDYVGEWEGCGPGCRDLEGVKWAVDVGIWVMCLGLGYLVSKASTKSLRRGLRARSGIL